MLAVAVLTGCRGAHEAHDPEHDHDHEHEKEAEASRENGHSEHGGDEIVWHEEEARAAGVRVEVVTPAPFAAVCKVSGTILPVAGGEQQVVATTAGVIKWAGNGFTEGASVRAGQAIARLSARELTDGDPAEKARLDYEAAQREWERAQLLVADKLISDQQLEEARLRYATAKAAIAGTAGRLTSDGVQIVAPANGYVKQCLVGAGEYVTVGQPLMVITQTRRLQLRAEVPEADAAQLAAVRSARFRTAASGGVLSLDSLGGRLQSVGRSVAPGAFYLPVIFDFDNVGALVPGGYAEVWLLGAERPDVLAVPRQALTEEQGVYFVYVQEDADCYRKQEVTTGADDGLRVEILSGLHGGERVVTSGAIRVKLAGASAAIPGHNHNH